MSEPYERAKELLDEVAGFLVWVYKQRPPDPAPLPTPTPTPIPPPPPPPVPTPTPPPPSLGSIETRFGGAPQDLSDGIRQFFPQDQWVAAAEISHEESGWNQYAHNNTLDKGPCGTRYWLSGYGYVLTEDSCGWFQINRCAHAEKYPDEFFNSWGNVFKASELYRARGNWGDWYFSAGKLGLPR